MMGLRDWLNTPLLRGKTAERWAPWLVQRPMVALAGALTVATAFNLAGALPAVVFAGVLAYPWAKQAYHHMRSALLPKQDRDSAPGEWPPEFNGAARAVRKFVRQHLPPRTSFSHSLKSDEVAVTYADATKSHIELDFKWFAQNAASPEQARDWALYAAAHEMAHAREDDYGSKVSLQIAQSLTNNMTLLASAVTVAGAALAVFASGPVAAAGLAFVGKYAGVMVGATAARGAIYLARQIYSRQSEYHCDRQAVALTRNLDAMASFAQQTPSYNHGRPSLLMNSLNSHPCYPNRLREAAHYLREIVHPPAPARKAGYHAT